MKTNLWILSITNYWCLILEGFLICNNTLNSRMFILAYNKKKMLGVLEKEIIVIVKENKYFNLLFHNISWMKFHSVPV